MLRVLENPLYYLDNVQDVLNWISARYADLLSLEETQFIAAFGPKKRDPGSSPG